MRGRSKTKKELTDEINELLERNARLEAREKDHSLARESFERSEMLIRKAFDTIPDLVAIIDRNFRILISNWHGGYEYVPEEVRSGNPACHEAYYGRKRPCRSCHVREVFRTGKSISWEKTNPHIGEVEIRAYPIFDESGKVVLVAENIRDITSRKLAEEELKRHRENLEELVRERTVELSRANDALIDEINERKLTGAVLLEKHEKLHAITETARDAIIMMDSEGKINFWNPAARKIFGYSSTEAMGKELHTFLAPERYHEYYKKGFDHFKVTGEGIAVGKILEMVAIRKGGAEFPIELSLSAFRIKGKWHAAGILRDITDRKHAEMELVRANEKLRKRSEQLLRAQDELMRKEKLAVLGQLAGRVGHELRNPLGVLNNAVYFLKTILPDADDTVKEYLDIIKQEVDISQRIITDLLSFSQSRPPETAPVSPDRLVEMSLRRCEIPENISVSTEIAKGLPFLCVDLHQMCRVIGNLVNNAVEAMPEGGSLYIAARFADHVGEDLVPDGSASVPEAPRQDFVEITVGDTGEGIGEEEMKKIFSPLFTTKTRRIGLGLAVSRNLAEANGGKISAMSLQGFGATFTLLLPVAKMQE